MAYKDIAGQKSGRLTAVRRLYVHNETSYWLCLCGCGNGKIVSLATFTRRPNISCGCLHSEIQRKRLTKHGMARTPEYHAWQAMHQRCKLPHHPEFHNYGARGIKVCEGWTTFPPFFAAMGLRPQPDLSVDRVDNDGNYSCGKCAECQRQGWPMNCRWATKTEQTINRRVVKRSQLLKASECGSGPSYS